MMPSFSLAHAWDRVWFWRGPRDSQGCAALRGGSRKPGFVMRYRKGARDPLYEYGSKDQRASTQSVEVSRNH